MVSSEGRLMFVQVHQEMTEHRKFRRLVRRLGTSVPTTIGHLTMLWSWAMTHAQDGTLFKCDAEDIADAALWEGDASTFVNALEECGWLDREDEGLVLHDWFSYGGKAFVMKEAAKKRMQAVRDRERARREREQECNDDERSRTFAEQAGTFAPVLYQEIERGEEDRDKDLDLDLEGRQGTLSVDASPAPSPAWEKVESLFGRKLPRTQAETFAEFVDEYPEPVLLYAIDQARMGNKPSLAYVRTICETHKDTGPPVPSPKTNGHSPPPKQQWSTDDPLYINNLREAK